MTRLPPLVVGTVLMATLVSVSAYQTHYGPAGVTCFCRTATGRTFLA